MRIAITAADRQIGKGGECIKAVLRRLHYNWILHAISRIQPEGRSYLAATGKVGDQAGGNVAHGNADLLRARTVDIDIKDRFPSRLLDTHVGDARNGANFRQQQVGVIKTRIQIVAADLQLDWRWRTEIQDLADDIGRRERKRDSGKLERELFTQLARIAVSGLVTLLQRDLNVAILRTHYPRVVVGQVDTAGR